MKIKVKATLTSTIALLLFCVLVYAVKSNDAVALVTIPGDYYSITEALNAVASNGRINVVNGTWCEYVRVTKPVSLISLNSSRFGVIIDGRYRNYPSAPYYIDVQVDNVTIEGFTFLATGDQIGIGVYAKNCRNLVIANCTFLDSTDIGIYLVNVANVILFNNYVESYCMPLILYECNNVTVTYNTFHGYQNLNIYNSSGLTFHHNNVVFKTCPYNFVYNTTGAWDDGLGHGNFWSNYNGTDLNYDGIGDTPYQIASLRYNGWEYYDYYPLMEDPQLDTPPLLIERKIRARWFKWFILTY